MVESETFDLRTWSEEGRIEDWGAQLKLSDPLAGAPASSMFLHKMTSIVQVFIKVLRLCNLLWSLHGAS